MIGRTAETAEVGWGGSGNCLASFNDLGVVTHPSLEAAMKVASDFAILVNANKTVIDGDVRQKFGGSFDGWSTGVTLDKKNDTWIPVLELPDGTKGPIGVDIIGAPKQALFEGKSSLHPEAKEHQNYTLSVEGVTEQPFILHYVYATTMRDPEVPDQHQFGWIRPRRSDRGWHLE